MKVFTVRLSDEIGALLENFCNQKRMKTSDALRNFVRDGLENANTKKEENLSNLKEDNDLNKKQQIAISASIESLLLLRNLVKDREILERAANKTEEIIKSLSSK